MARLTHEIEFFQKLAAMPHDAAPGRRRNGEVDAKAQGDIPDLFHITWPSDGHGPNVVPRPWNYLMYACARSVIVLGRPALGLYIHVVHGSEPTGQWWQDTLALPGVQLKYMREVTSLFGRKLTLPAHMADVNRLEIVLQYGGVYVDTDLLVIRSFKSLLGERGVVMGYEAADDGVAYGLCNGLFLSRPRERFLKEWYERLRTQFFPVRWERRVAGTAPPPLKLRLPAPGKRGVARGHDFVRSWLVAFSHALGWGKGS